MKWCLTVLLLFVSGTLTAAQVAGYYECPSPWQEHQDNCYKFEMMEATLADAGASCENDGASLVSVNNFQENDYIISKLRELDIKGLEWYTSGMRDSKNTDQYTWEGDGTPVEGAEFWFPKASMDIDQGMRIVYYTDDGVEWGWRWRPAEGKRPYICEISKADSYKIVEDERGFGYGVSETDAAAFERGPVFTLQPRDVIYDSTGADDFTSMECEAKGNPNPDYEWYIQRGASTDLVDPNKDRRYTLINGKLLISEPDQTKDNGDYYCVSKNKYGAILSNTVQLSFGYLLDFPKSDRDPISVNAYAGTGIECNPPQHGYGSVLFSWYKNEIPNFIRPELKPYVFISGNGKLYFSSVTVDDEGYYHCLVSPPGEYASRAEGKVSMPIELEVTQTIGSIEEPKLASGFPRVFPSSPKRGNNIRIECFAYASPPELTYTWERIGGIMPKQAVYQDWGRVLSIPNVQLVHSGRYRCNVKRLNGQSDEGVVQLPVESAPFFTIPLQDQHVDAESTLTWRCISDGIPTPSYEWYRNATKLDIDKLPAKDRSRYSINSNVLTIENVNKDDAAMYQCKASNTHGAEYSSAQLRILSLAPTFEKFPLQPMQYATLNNNLTIICSPEAAPYPQISWQKDGRDLNPSFNENSGNVIQLPNGNLHIRKVKQSDAGIYTCIAVNDLGTAESSIELDILTSTTLTQQPQDKTVEVNNTAFFRCEAAFSPVFDVTYDWYHNNRKLDFIRIYSDGSSKVWIEKEPYFERGTGINKGSLYIRDTQFYHAGDYTCVAKTSNEEIRHTVSLQVVGPPSEPAGIYGETPTTNSIQLHWSEANPNGRPITNFIIEAYNMREGFWKRIKANIRGDDMERRSTLIEDLSPWTQYKFRVRAENDLGESNPSEESPTYQTLPDKPDMIPQNIGGGGGKVGVLTIHWDPIPTDKAYGEGLGYIVKWKRYGMEDEEYDICRVINDEVDPSDENCLLKAVYNVHKNNFVVTLGAESCYFDTRTNRERCSNNYYSRYQVTVIAFNQMGEGPQADEDVVIRSAEGLPTAVPTNIRAVYYNSTALLVEWDPVEDTIEAINGILKGYRINYWKEVGEDETMAIFRPIPGQTDHGLVVGLYPWTYYIVNVQVYNEAGVGPKSQEFVQETLRSAPKEAPQEVRVEPIDYNSIHVEWRGVSTEIGEEPLEGYMVRYWRQGENMHVAEDYDAMKRTWVEIDGLDEGIIYNLRVFGYSRGGEGLKSSPTLEFILGPNCIVREDQPEKEYVYRCASCQLHASSLALLTSLLAMLYNVVQPSTL